MAKRIDKGIQIDLSLNLSDLQKQSSKIKALLNDTDKALRNLNKIKVLDGSFATSKQELKTLGERIKFTEKYIESLNSELSSMKNENIDETSSKFTKVQLAIAKANNEINNYKEQYNKLENEIKETENITKDLGTTANKTGIELNKAGNSDFDKVNDSAIKLKTTMIATGVALGNLASSGLTKLINETKELVSSVNDIGIVFDEGMATLKALYGDDIDTSGLEKLKNKARELGQITQWSATEVTGSMKFMALAGYSAEETLTSIKDALDLASASGEQFDIVANIMVDGLKAFNMSASESSRFANVLAQTAVSTNADVEDLGEAFKYAGALSGMFGYRIEDVSVALGTMAEKGIKGSIAGTALRQVMTRLSTNTSGALDLFKKLGGEFFNLDGSARPLIDVLDDLKNMLKETSDEEQANILSTIAGQRAITGLSAIVNTSAERWEYLKNQINNTSGAVNKIANERLDNYAGDVKKLANNWQEVKLRLYTGVEPALRDTTQELIKLMQSANFKSVIKDIVDLANSLIKNLGSGVKFAINNFKELASVSKIIIEMAVMFKAVNGISKLTGRSIDNLSFKFKKFHLNLGAVSAVITGVILLMESLNYAGKLNKQQWELENQELVALTESVKKNKEAQLESLNVRKEEISNAESEFAYYKGLQDQLGYLVDSNGKVKDGYEEQVQYILNELSTAYGIEFDLIDGQIQGYDNLREAIKKTSEQKMISATLDSFSKKYQEDIENYYKAIGDYSNAKVEYSKLLSEGIKELNNASPNDERWNFLGDGDSYVNYKTYSDATLEQKEKFVSGWLEQDLLLGDKSGELHDIMNNSKEIMATAINGMNDIDKAYSLAEQGDVFGLISLSNATIEGKNKVEQSLEETKKILEAGVEQLRSDLSKEKEGTSAYSTIASELDTKLNELDLINQKIGGIDTKLSEFSFNIFDPFSGGFGNATDLISQYAKEMDTNVNTSIGSMRTGFNGLSSNILKPIVSLETMKNIDVTSGLNTQLSTLSTNFETTATSVGGNFANTLGENINAGLGLQFFGLNETGLFLTNQLSTTMDNELNLGLTALKSTVGIKTTEAENQNKLTHPKGYSRGNDYVKGVNAGLNSGLASVRSTAAAICATVDEALQKSWQIHSPSRKAYDISKNYPLGIINAFEDYIPAVSNVASNLSNEVNKSIENTQKSIENGSSAISNIDVQSNLTVTLESALSKVQLVLHTLIDMDGSEVAQHINELQGLEIKKAGI